MNNATDMKKENAFTKATEKLAAISTLREIMGKHGYHLTYMSAEKHYWFHAPHVHQKKLVLMYVPHTKEKSTLFSIYQDLEKLTQDYMKQSKRSKMEWYTTTDMSVVVEISEVRNSLFLLTPP